MTGRTRVVVLFALANQVEGGCYGLVSQVPGRTPIISQVRMINEAPWIPDLERIEQMISGETSVLAE